MARTLTLFTMLGLAMARHPPLDRIARQKLAGYESTLLGCKHGTNPFNVILGLTEEAALHAAERQKSTIETFLEFLVPVANSSGVVFAVHEQIAVINHLGEYD